MTMKTSDIPIPASRWRRNLKGHGRLTFIDEETGHAVQICGLFRVEVDVGRSFDRHKSNVQVDVTCSTATDIKGVVP